MIGSPIEEIKILKIREHPEFKIPAANWFHEKWKIPLEAYFESMDECLEEKGAVPQWYIAVDVDKIIGGLGVIENDFHKRRDLSPNVCAVYVEKEYRCRGIAGKMLDFVCSDMEKIGVTTLYLVTDHTSFYEHYGWEFFCMVECDGEENQSRMYIHKAAQKRKL